MADVVSGTVYEFNGYIGTDFLRLHNYAIFVISSVENKIKDGE